MIILDTNVVSELMRPAPERRVLHWFSSQATEDLHVTSVTMAEILHGIELFAGSRRRDALRGGAEKMFEGVFADHVLIFEDRACARVFADCVISAPARQTHVRIRCADRGDRASARVTLATRSPYAFEECGVRLVNPWEGSF